MYKTCKNFKIMKKIIAFTLLLLVPSLIFAQKTKPTAPVLPIDTETSMVSYNNVIDATGVSQKEMYARAIKWVKEFYPIPSSVFQVQDSINMKIVCKGKFDAKKTLKNGTQQTAERILYNLTIQFKEGRYKYEITKVLIQGSTSIPVEKYFDENDIAAEDHFATLTSVDENLTNIANSLKTRLEQPSVKIKKDEW